jgi:hypothetical protein
MKNYGRPILGCLLTAAIACNVSASNLFVANYFNNNISEITPGGAQSIFATG